MRNKRIALVTGGNRGIGLAIVQGLANLGYEVIMGSRNKKAGEKVRRGLSSNKHIYVVELDVSRYSSIKRIYNIIEKRSTCLDILINNAGIYGTSNNALMSGNILEMKEIMEVNYYGPMAMNAILLPLLRKSDSGRIINMSSGMGAHNDLVEGHAGYRLSKAGLNAQTIQLSNELKNEDISVFAMCPGWVRTDMGGQNATRSVEEGADTAIWLATTKDAKTGKFYRDRKIISW